VIVYLDASAMVKRYVAEIRSPEVEALIGEAQAIATAVISRAEVAAALSKAARLGLIAREAGEKALRMRPGMGAKGSAYDNAVAESFFSNLKNELVHHRVFDTREVARAALFDYIELFYNRRRLHQSLDYRTPMQCEQDYDRGA
jgi:transposase InsO family protein